MALVLDFNKKLQFPKKNTNDILSKIQSHIDFTKFNWICNCFYCMILSLLINFKMYKETNHH